MLAQRLTQHSARRVIASHRMLSPLPKFLPQTLIATTHPLRPSSTTTTTTTSTPQPTLLETQRRARPIAPHLSIYQPQITWYLSALNRITGSLLSGGFYLFGAAYLVAPLAGWHLESAALAAAVATWPAAVKVGVKFGVASPFVFHCFNGVRHLVWDTGRELTNRSVQVTGWLVVGATVAGSGVLAAL